jgi:SPP1 gp7 family putative phage head morphogenesis protein
VDGRGTLSREAFEGAAAPSVSEDLVRETEKLLTVSYLLGRDHVGSRLDLADPDPEVPAISLDEAVKFAKARVPLTRAEWTTLEPELRFRAFTVAALSTHDNIEKVRQMSIKAVEDGTPLSEFWTEANALDAAGLGSSPWYWETVYRTNTQTCYNAGRAAEFTRTQPEYLEFVGIEDGRQTEICAARSGVIRPASDPWWRLNWPPLHFNCRSTVRAVYQEEVDLLRETNPNWEPTATDTLTHDSPAKGFGANPVSSGSFYKLTPAMIDRAKQYGILDDIKALGKTLGLRYDPVSLSSVASESGVPSIDKTIPADSGDRAALRKNAKETLNALRNQSFTNTALGEEVTLNKTGIDHAVSFAGDPTKLAVLDHIPDIMKAATDFSVEPEAHGNPSYTEVLRGKAVLEVNGQRNLFAVVLKRKKDGTLVFYDLMPWEQK